MKLIEWFFSLFFRSKLKELKLQNATEKMQIAKEYQVANEKYRQKFLKPKRYRKIPTN